MFEEQFTKNLKQRFTPYFFYLGENYPKEFITFISKRKVHDGEEFTFQLEDRYSYMNYSVAIKKVRDRFYFNCDCRRFRMEQKCEHIPACFLHYAHLFFSRTDKDIESISKRILEHYKMKEERKTVKEEVNIDVKITFYERYYDKVAEVSIKVGTDRLYALNESKIKKLLNAYRYQNEKVTFGKQFTYNPEKHFFKKENKEFLEFLSMRMQKYYRSVLNFDEDEINLLFEKLEKIDFEIDGLGKFHGIQKTSPFHFNLTKKEDKFILNIPEAKEYELITKDGNYARINDKIYKIPHKYHTLLELLTESNLDKLIFNAEEFGIFNKGLLPVIKDDIKVDEAIKDVIISTKPTPKLYFDLMKPGIIGHIKFLYKDEEIDYFDPIKSNVLRDLAYENEVENDLLELGFTSKNKSFLLEDTELIGNFLEGNMQNLASKYEIFTTKKFENMRVIKKNNITSTFFIGQDNILSYHFDLGEINEKDLPSLLDSLKKRKKYYRLKNGNIIDLNDKKLEELSHFLEDMEIDGKTFDGEIPKYRALYLSSLKNEEFSIIRTNDLFEDFIQKFNNYKNVELNFTKNEKKILRDYQLTGVKWLYQIHKCDFGGILADEMGLGKSLQVMIFIKKLLEEDNTSKFLIVVPTSLMYNWDREFQKFNLGLNYQIIAGNKKEREKLINEDTNIYITSYGLLREDIDLYEDKNFKVCILDEAQNIKNPKTGITKCTKKIKSETRLALTGTPLENSMLELWSIFDFIMPGFLSSESKFNQKYKIKAFDEEENNLLTRLNHQISPFILRRKKKDVIKDLPDKIENNIYIDLTEKEKKLYMANVKDAKETMDKLIKEEGFQKAKFIILQLLTKLRQLCIDPRILYSNIKEKSSKIETLIKVVKEVIAHGHKVLIFSSFRTSLDIVAQEFNNENITSYRIDGSVQSKKRMELVEKFNHDNTNVFLIMLKSGGTGLNLTAADIVIHLDLWWNPQAESQATDRAHRIGQKNVVEVIKLVTKGTIEEKIFDLQKKKKMLSDKLIEGDDREKNLLSTLSEKELRNLLSYENKEEL